MSKAENASALVYEAALKTPDIGAIRLQSEEVSYKELNDIASTIASVLIANGAKNETVGIVGQRNITSCLGVLGALYAGCSYTPVNTKYPEHRVQQIVDDSSIRFVIGQLSDLKVHSELFKRNNIKLLLPSDIVSNKELESIDRDRMSAFEPVVAPVSVNEADTAYILYTSGSTGNPKGVQVTHGNLHAFLRNMNRLYPVPAGFRASQTFDLSFDLSVCDIFFTWINSGTLCVLSEDEKLLPSEYIRREEIYFWYSVPTLANIMNRFGVLSENAFPSLKYSLFCGEPLPLALAEKWASAAPESTVENVYGPTEATIHLIRRVYSDSDAGREFSNGIVPIGLPFSDHTIEMIDENGQLLEHGETGQLVFKGPQITKGYLHDEEKTRSAFVQFDWDASGDVWYLSGDLGFYNIDGDIECLGRLDSQIKFAGRRVEIGEIESAIRKYPKLLDACVLPVRDEDQIVRSLVAFTTSSLTQSEEDHIRSDSQHILESIFFPAEIVSVDEFPTTNSGKIDRKNMLDTYLKNKC